MFLGAPSREQDKWVIERAQKLTKRGHNISINNKAPNSINAGEIEWLPMKEFNNVLSKADILLNPVRKIEKNPPGIPNEKRGVSMATGIIHDSIRHAKPLILPDHFIINDIIQEHTLTYDSAEELGELLIQVATDREKVRQINDKAIKNAKNYSLERQRERFTHLINSVLI
jgi:glycosyltransferase involved in cell wall biosynthesis